MRDPHDVRMEREMAIQKAIKNAVAAADEIILSKSNGSEEVNNGITKMACRCLLHYVDDLTRPATVTITAIPPPPYNMILKMVVDLIRDAIQGISKNWIEQMLLETYLLTEVTAKFMDKVRMIPAASLRRWELEHPEIFETG